jgi:hypothetical protein
MPYTHSGLVAPAPEVAMSVSRIRSSSMATRMSRIRSFCMAAIALALVLAGPWAAGAQTEIVYTISPDDALLRTIDPATAATLTSSPITLAGTTVLGGTGLAPPHPRAPGTS